MDALKLASAFHDAKKSPDDMKAKQKFEGRLEAAAKDLIKEHRSTFVSKNNMMPGVIKLWVVMETVEKLYEKELAEKVTGTILGALIKEGCKIATTPMAVP